MGVRNAKVGADGFTLPQLAEIADIEYRTLHTWVKRGLLRASLQESGGTGSPNRFSAADAIGARILGDLRRSGLSMNVLEQAASELQAARATVCQPAVILVNGHVEILPDFADAIEMLDRPGTTLVYRTREAIELVAAAGTNLA